MGAVAATHDQAVTATADAAATVLTSTDTHVHPATVPAGSHARVPRRVPAPRSLLQPRIRRRGVAPHLRVQRRHQRPRKVPVHVHAQATRRRCRIPATGALDAHACRGSSGSAGKLRRQRRACLVWGWQVRLARRAGRCLKQPGRALLHSASPRRHVVSRAADGGRPVATEASGIRRQAHPRNSPRALACVTSPACAPALRPQPPAPPPPTGRPCARQSSATWPPAATQTRRARCGPCTASRRRPARRHTGTRT